jgi:hypothetical protein
MRSVAKVQEALIAHGAVGTQNRHPSGKKCVKSNPKEANAT